MTDANSTTLPSQFASRWVNAMLATILGDGDGNQTEATASLGELDRQSGDSDFGPNLTTAFTRVRGEIEARSPQRHGEWQIGRAHV